MSQDDRPPLGFQQTKRIKLMFFLRSRRHKERAGTADDLAGIADGQRIVRYRSTNDSAGANHAIGADGGSGQQDRVLADEAVVADHDAPEGLDHRAA